MPTRTRLPSRLAHSCSRVYLRSAGISDMAPSGLLDAWRMKRRCDDPRGLRLPADLDGEVAADGGVRRRDVRHADVPVDRRPVGAGRHDAGRLPAREHRIAVPRDGLLGHLETDELSRDAARAHLLDGVAPDEV